MKLNSDIITFDKTYYFSTKERYCRLTTVYILVFTSTWRILGSEIRLEDMTSGVRRDKITGETCIMMYLRGTLDKEI